MRTLKVKGLKWEDLFEYVQIEYPSHLVTIRELKEYLISEKAEIQQRKNTYQQYAETDNFFLERQADGMPSIGNCELSLEALEVNWK